MTEKAIELKGIRFAYDGGGEVMRDLDFTLRYGEFAILAGVSGNGKTTLLSIISGVIPGIVPGKLEGSIRLDGQDMTGVSLGKRARLVGSVFQNPEDQIVHDRVEDEVAFGCENLGIPEAEIAERVDRALKRTQLKAGRETRKLSGGQKQRLMAAATFAMGQRILLLDEPLANLDRQSAIGLLRTLREMADEGCAVLMVEHRLDLALTFADTVYSLSEGQLIEEKNKEALRTRSQTLIPYDNDPITGGRILISLRDVYYGISHIDVLRGVNLDIRAGERVTVLGPNGCGKTTLLKILARLIYPSSGGYEQHLIRAQHVHARPEWFRAAGYVHQNPSYQLFMPTLWEEILRGAKTKERAERMIALFGLSGLEGRHPQSLSEGQKRRADVAAVCATEPGVLFLDEPTVGQDDANLTRMLESLHLLQKESGCAIVTVTHDVRCKEALSDRRVIMKMGRII